MFGINKNKMKEQLKDAFAQIDQYREETGVHVLSFEGREKQIRKDVGQVMENTTALTEYALQNVQEEAALLQEMENFSNQFTTALEEYRQIVEMVAENSESVINLVEENKHYTTPSRHLTEIPGLLRQEYQSYERKTDALAEDARKMSVQAINAAVEAGRMGESGKKFVVAAEELRQMALDNEKSALAMKEELQASQERIQELEDFVSRLVSMMKEGNVATTRIMKKSMALNKAVKNSSMRAFSDDVICMRDKVVSMRNMDEEIVKAGERNKLLLADVQEELQAQKQELGEFESDLNYVFDEAQKKIHK